MIYIKITFIYTVYFYVLHFFFQNLYMFICDATNKKRTNIFFRTLLYFNLFYVCIYIFKETVLSSLLYQTQNKYFIYFCICVFFSSCLSNVLQIKILIQVERFIVKGFHYRNHRSTSVLKTGSGLRQPSFTAGASPLQTLSFFAARFNHRCTFFLNTAPGQNVCQKPRHRTR